jgi:hypothetical protein
MNAETFLALYCAFGALVVLVYARDAAHSIEALRKSREGRQ